MEHLTFIGIAILVSLAMIVAESLIETFIPPSTGRAVANALACVGFYLVVPELTSQFSPALVVAVYLSSAAFNYWKGKVAS